MASEERHYQIKWQEWAERKGNSALVAEPRSVTFKSGRNGRIRRAEKQRELVSFYGNTPNYGKNVIRGSITHAVVTR